ncbi:MAG: aconitase X catalytic domain-containing protein [archaeon]
MKLTKEEQEMLSGKQGNAVKKSMEILTALGDIFGAERLIDVKSVQIAGVSYHNLEEAGLEFLEEMAKDGKAKVFTTLNPAGMDLKEWQKLGISPEFAEKQLKVIEAFSKMGVKTTCTCTPYLIGNRPKKGDHIAWSESSAVCFANSVLGAYTNREGGPSAIASALTGKTPEFDLHLDKNRQAQVIVEVKTPLKTLTDWGALGHAIGEKAGKKIALITGVKKADEDSLKIFSASIATYAGAAIFHIEGITPNKTVKPKERIEIAAQDLAKSKAFLTDASEVDIIAVGCPHCSLAEMETIAKALEGKKVKKEFWICVSREIKDKAAEKGFVKKIEASGAKIACDTCMAVAPLKGRFKGLATNSAKAIFYGRGKNSFKTIFCDLDKCIEEATR